MSITVRLSTVIAISIAGMLGGIFVLPGIAAAQTGSSIWVAFLVAAICIFPAVLSKSELATAMPSSGGSYVYIERAFGPIFGILFCKKTMFSIANLMIFVDFGCPKRSQTGSK